MNCRSFIVLFLVGVTCGQETDECAPSPCQNGGTCMDLINDYFCNCTSEWMGKDCTEVYDPCVFLTPCENGATCASNPPAPTYNCTCVLGFDGTNCENNIDDCINVDCPNDGTVCFDLVNSYECKCPIGYEGTQCAVEIDECALNPCVNGNCNDYVAFYNCSCNAGYEGVNCSKDIDECASLPCENDGICVDKVNGFECFCPNGVDGTQCEIDNDECLSEPCLNGATCAQSPVLGNVNCTCVPGFSGDFCGTDINECASSPCQNGATCEDNINEYNCTCVSGYVGVNCEIEFNECDSSPCLNRGICIDLVNEFKCNCSNTGFTGDTCEINIDECESSPCQHESSCIDLINDYNCTCHAGYEGKNCETDIQECASFPCQNGGTCFERSNASLYGNNGPFDGSFSYNNAAGFICECIPGFVDTFCETDFDECASSACQNGATCTDLVNSFRCDCSPGYQGVLCDVEIDECEPSPCAVGSTCVDLVAAYKCQCVDGYGGFNCDIALTGCDGHSQCQNDATCIPSYNITSSTHEFTCFCLDGFIGTYCQISTAASFDDGSYLVDSSVSGKDVLNYTLQFATTLPSGLLLYSENQGGYLLVELFNAQLFLKYSGENESPLELNNVNSGLNDGSFHTLSLTITSSAITLTIASTPVTESITIPNDYTLLVFGELYIGSVDPSLEANVAERSQSDGAYVGCMQDIANNDGDLILPAAGSTRRKRRQTSATADAGCNRVEQCIANTCSGQGSCVDLWWTFSCDCDPTWTGPTCNNTLIPATFSHEDTTSYAEFTQTANVSTFTALELSFRTRKPSGLLFYSELGSSYIALELINGKVTIASSFSSKIQTNDAYNDAYYHYVSVVRDAASLSLVVDSETFLNVSATANDNMLLFTTHYVGGFTASPGAGVVGDYFKGCIVDVRYNELHLEFYPVSITNFTLNSWAMSSSSSEVLEGCVSDDACKLNPCSNNGTCTITWNDYECTCTKGFKGKNCTEETACSLGACPANTTCNDLVDGGIECVTVRTFDTASSIMYVNNVTNTDLTSMSLQLRTRNQYGLLLHSNNVDDFFTLQISEAKVLFKFAISGNSGTLETSATVTDGNWHKIDVVISNSALKIILDEVDDASESVAITSFNAVITNTGSSFVYLGDVDFTNTDFFDNKIGFDGCLEEVRVGQLLLPFLEQDQYKSTSPEQFTISTIFEITSGCQGRAVCDPNPCLNGATCQDTFNDYTCNCAGGFDGVHCSNNIDECSSSPCVYGSCLDGINLYTCQCFAGYNGSNCEVDINECESNPCENNSTCTDLINDFSCFCSTNYTGRTCSDLILDLVTCDDMPCMNGATCKNVTNPGPNMPLIECICVDGYEDETCSSEINYCINNTCMNGVCMSSVAILDYTCDCFTGYEGTFCETNIDECASNPCENGGMCVDKLNSYECMCIAGYQGTLCEEDIDECSSSPCVQGTCSDGVNSFTCTCDEGYTGVLCDWEGPCVGSPCQNGGTCTHPPGDKPENYTCSCVTGYKGVNCEVEIDWCNPDPCQNGATCTSSPPGSVCTCADGYKGDSCDVPLSCTSLPCMNNGLCSEETSGFSCACTEGFSGDTCNVNIDECESGPCNNNANCTDSVNGYNCSCSTGWQGTHCETDINECAPLSPCENSGSCTNSQGSYSCTCPPNYVGSNCQFENPCMSSPCENGGTCDYSLGDDEPTYKCKCDPKYEGSSCETVVGAQDDKWIIIGGALGGVAVVIIIVILIIFLLSVKNRRRSQGTYSPSRQEVTGSRVEMDNILKIPPEERLI